MPNQQQSDCQGEVIYVKLGGIRIVDGFTGSIFKIILYEIDLKQFNPELCVRKRLYDASVHLIIKCKLFNTYVFELVSANLHFKINLDINKSCLTFLNFEMSHTKIFVILKDVGVIFIFNVQKLGQYYFVGWILNDFLMFNQKRPIPRSLPTSSSCCSRYIQLKKYVFSRE